jgi:hypothetical protein
MKYSISVLLLVALWLGSAWFYQPGDIQIEVTRCLELPLQKEGLPRGVCALLKVCTSQMQLNLQLLY